MPRTSTCALLAELFRDADFDVIHSHLDVWALPFAAVSSIPTVTTLHGRLDLPMLRSVLGMYPDLPLVSISDAQRRPLDGLRLNWLDTVPHGLDLSDYLQQPRTQGDHLVFVGRVCPEKGLDTAITVARRCGTSLHIAAKVDPIDVEYFESRIDPLLGDDTVFLGEIGEDRKPSFFADAAATLFPINWPEPFGIVMIESLAAGTPVIALRTRLRSRGARRRRHRVHLRQCRRAGRGRRQARRDRPRGVSPARPAVQP